jgi:hypothetical protein
MEKLEFWKKPYLGSKASQTASPNVRAGVQSGFLLDAGIASAFLSNTAAPHQLGVGVFGFFDTKTGQSVNAASPQVTTGKMLLLANTSFHLRDQIGTHGGYLESYKSRGINPRYITAWKKITCAAPEKAVCHLGNTNFTYDVTASITTAGAGYANDTYEGVPLSGTGTGMLATIVVAGGAVTSVVITSPGSGYLVGDVLTFSITDIPWASTPGTAAALELETYSFCNYTFHCGETYPLQIAIGGNAVLSVLNHEVPRRVTAYGGCCPTDVDAPTEIDSTLIMIEWSKKIIESTYFNSFIRPIVYDQLQNPLFATSAEAVAAGYPSTQIWDNYVSPGYITGNLAGIRFEGAYVDTRFGNCSFQYSDSAGIVEPIKIIDASILTDAGFPCKDTLCFTCETAGFSGIGFGEDVLREFIDDTTRRTTMFCEDQRMREIEGGSDLLNSFNRSGLYTRFVLRHKIPHNENINQHLNDENYELNIYIPCSGATTPTVAALETFVSTWLQSVDSIVSLETDSHTPFVYEAI